MTRRKPLPIKHVASCLIIAAMCALGARFEPAHTSIAGFFIDGTVWLRAHMFPEAIARTPPEKAKTIVIALDQNTLDAEDFRGVPRVLHSRYLAQAAQKALDHGASLVAFDMVFAFQGPRDETDLSNAIAAFEKPLEDLVVAERRGGRIILATTEDAEPAERFSRVFTRTRGIAHAEILIDADGVMRRVPAALETQSGTVVPTLSGLARERMADDDKPMPWDQSDPVHLAPPFSILDLPTLSLADLRACEDEATLRSLFEGRAVFFGGAIKIEDQVVTADRFLPRKPTELLPCATHQIDAGRPGVFAHAAAVDGALREWSPEVIGARALRAIQASFLIALFASLGAIFLKPWSGALITFVLLPAFFFGLRAWFLNEGLLLAFAAPILSAPIAFTLSLSVKTLIFDQDKRRLKRQFSKYLADNVIEEMANSGAEPKLGGAAAEVTVMFVDLSGFTKFSEAWGPHWEGGVMEVLNRYLTIISQTIEENGGYVDKFIGDAVMAIWNAPRPVSDHSARAVAAALQIRERVAEETRLGKHNFTVKIGLECGRATVGNVGSPNRLEFSAIGDTVNLAARLEGASGRFGAGLLIGPAAAYANQASNGPQLMRLVQLQVKGRQSATSVFTPLCADMPDVASIHRTALDQFETGQFDAAAATWRQLDQETVPWAQTMIELAESMGQTEPDKWAGVVELKDK